MKDGETAHGTNVLAVGVRYVEWRDRIERAPDVDGLLRIVREYLGAWGPDQLAPLPVDIAATALLTANDISVRAVLAAQADATSDGDEAGASLVREMALTLGAAESRLRRLQRRNG